MGRRKAPTFEEMMEELSGIVDSIGRDDCPVDELDERVKRAAFLIRTLRSRLETTEVSVREILGGLSGETGGAACSGSIQHVGMNEADRATPFDASEEDEEEEED